MLVFLLSFQKYTYTSSKKDTLHPYFLNVQLLIQLKYYLYKDKLLSVKYIKWENYHVSKYSHNCKYPQYHAEDHITNEIILCRENIFSVLWAFITLVSTIWYTVQDLDILGKKSIAGKSTNKLFQWVCADTYLVLLHEQNIPFFTIKPSVIVAIHFILSIVTVYVKIAY